MTSGCLQGSCGALGEGFLQLFDFFLLTLIALPQATPQGGTALPQRRHKAAAATGSLRSQAVSPAGLGELARGAAVFRARARTALQASQAGQALCCSPIGSTAAEGRSLRCGAASRSMASGCAISDRPVKPAQLAAVFGGAFHTIDQGDGFRVPFSLAAVGLPSAHEASQKPEAGLRGGPSR